MNETHDGDCAVAATTELIGSKWTPLIVHDLSEGPRRFMQLEHACVGISPRTLSERLDMLEHEGIVTRRSFPGSPPRVEYELTDKGKALAVRLRSRVDALVSRIQQALSEEEIAQFIALVSKVAGAFRATPATPPPAPTVRRIPIEE